MSTKSWTIVVEVIKDGLIFLFFFIACSKLLRYHLFTDSIIAQPIPWVLQMLVIYTLPYLLLLISVLLIIPRFKRWGLYTALGLISIISLYMVLVLCHLFARIPCSCGGLYMGITWTNQLLINAAILCSILTAIYGSQIVYLKTLAYEKTT
jgi:hypothetical protein